jgi:hypothetical protein
VHLALPVLGIYLGISEGHTDEVRFLDKGMHNLKFDRNSHMVLYKNSAYLQ